MASQLPRKWTGFCTGNRSNPYETLALEQKKPSRLRLILTSLMTPRRDPSIEPERLKVLCVKCYIQNGVEPKRLEMLRSNEVETMPLKVSRLKGVDPKPLKVLHLKGIDTARLKVLRLKQVEPERLKVIRSKDT